MSDRSIAIRFEDGAFEAGIFDGEQCCETIPISVEHVFDLRESINQAVTEAIGSQRVLAAQVFEQMRMREAAAKLFDSLRNLVGLAEIRGRLDEYKAALRDARSVIDKVEGRS